MFHPQILYLFRNLSRYALEDYTYLPILATNSFCLHKSFKVLVALGNGPNSWIVALLLVWNISRSCSKLTAKFNGGGDPNSSATALSLLGEYLKRSSLEVGGIIWDVIGVFEENGSVVFVELGTSLAFPNCVFSNFVLTTHARPLPGSLTSFCAGYFAWHMFGYFSSIRGHWRQ